VIFLNEPTPQEINCTEFSPVGASFAFDVDEKHCAEYWKHIEPIFKAFGVKLHKNSKIKMLDDNEEAMTVWDNGNGAAFVVFDDKLPLNQQYIALCHEIGHIALNHPQRFKAQGLKLLMEHESEAFAYGLLRIISKLEGLTK